MLEKLDDFHGHVSHHMSLKEASVKGAKKFVFVDSSLSPSVRNLLPYLAENYSEIFGMCSENVDAECRTLKRRSLRGEYSS